ncbi:MULTISPECIES: dihydrofolate reductase family protein [unclassified Bosea (in: a-proteobacteria)]|uniref:dihydrofolate reductase family protein n=1 Tax=unclassified Bosea (in: a-proteobacteria) TaxID=2653178 RepID=UPI000F763075|nr:MULTISPECIES: dihydrofolate reductase family protein [unclassified Bosea (in: a-proteobacteria)]AZO80075.1 riboflavin biosynthesis protein RibD [Bosea sp. Tri-49]RXT22861.1 riboflavin biosynthesis protein RibD [Bosea sp. Tri-39]RXT38330.1 riboflavin biosynthesis protein RibD [Bosea sp. Tri-54]
MAKVIAWNLVTLDGYFEGTEKWDLSFHNEAWGEELDALSKEFGQRAQCLVFGRVTHDGMKAHWTTAKDSEVTRYMNALPKLVASRSVTSSDWNNTRVTADIVGEIAKLRAAPGKDVLVFGSAELIDTLLAAKQIDELMLAVVPVRLGAGTPFFKAGGERQKLDLLENRPLKNGTVILRYAPEH